MDLITYTLNKKYTDKKVSELSQETTAEVREATAVANQAVENVEAFKGEIQGDLATLTQEIEEITSDSPNLLPVAEQISNVLGADVLYADGTVTINGTATGNGGRLVPIAGPFELNAGTYTFSLDMMYERRQFFVENESTILAQISGAANTASFTLDEKTSVYVGTNVSEGEQLTNTIYKLQIERGDTASEVVRPSWMTAVDKKARDGVSAAENANGKIKEDLDALDRSLNQLGENVGSLTEDVNGLSDGVNQLSNSVDNLAKQTDDVEKAVTQPYGFNILPNGKKLSDVNGVLIAYEGGVVSFEGTANANGGRLTPVTETFVLHAGTYTLSGIDVPEQFFIESGNSVIASITSAHQEVAFTLNEDTAVYLGVNVTSGTQYSCTSYIQIEEGSASAWRPVTISAVDKYVREGFVTPEMYGAKGNGITPDGAALQAAFNSGKPVKMSGVYNVYTETPHSQYSYLYFPDGLELEGGTLKFPDNGNTSEIHTGINLAVGNSFTVRNCCFDMNGYNNIPTSVRTMYAIFVENCAGVVVENCHFKNSAGRNYIFVKQGIKFTLKNCTFKNGGTNILGSDAEKQDDFSYIYTSANNSIVDGCTIYEPDNDPFTYCGGFEMHGDNSVIQNCLIHKCLPGIYVARHQTDTNPNKNVKVLNNTLLNCQGAISLFDNHTLIGILVKGNYITLSPVTPVPAGMYGIGSGANNILKNVVISDNVISQETASPHGGSGIAFARADGVIVSNNHITDVSNPIILSGTLEQRNVTIKDNIISASTLRNTYAISKPYYISAIDGLVLKDNNYTNYVSIIDSMAGISNLVAFDSPRLAESTRNLMPSGVMEVEDRGVKSVYDNGMVVLSGYATGSIGRLTPRSPYFTLPAGTYTFSTTDMPEQLFIESGSNIIATLAGSNRSVTFTLMESTTLYFAINVKPDAENDFAFAVQIENGREATPIRPTNWCSAIDRVARQ